MGAVSALIAPLEYAGDIRPYFTIYDGDFEYYKQHVQGHSMGQSAVLLGATNPVVFRVLSDMPTCLVLSPRTPSSTPDGGGTTAMVPVPQGQHEVVFQHGSVDRLQRARLAGYDVGTRNGRRGLRNHGFTLEPDSLLLQCLDIGRGQSFNQSQASARDDVLRRYFFDLTLAFLHPFLPHLGEVSLSLSSVGPDPDSALAEEFDEATFLDTLQPVGSFAALPHRSCRDLYRRFINGANFRPWLERQK